MLKFKTKEKINQNSHFIYDEYENPDPYDRVHEKEIKQVLERASIDNDFLASLLYCRSDVLEPYDLTSPEKSR